MSVCAWPTAIIRANHRSVAGSFAQGFHPYGPKGLPHCRCRDSPFAAAPLQARVHRPGQRSGVPLYAQTTARWQEGRANTPPASTERKARSERNRRQARACRPAKPRWWAHTIDAVDAPRFCDAKSITAPAASDASTWKNLATKQRGFSMYEPKRQVGLPRPGEFEGSTPSKPMAERVGFEPTRPGGLPVFKTGAFNRSATAPYR